MPALQRRPFNTAARHSSTRNKLTHYDKHTASCGEHIFYFLFTRRYPPPFEAARTRKASVSMLRHQATTAYGNTIPGTTRQTEGGDQGVCGAIPRAGRRAADAEWHCYGVSRLQTISMGLAKISGAQPANKHWDGGDSVWVFEGRVLLLSRAGVALLGVPKDYHVLMLKLCGDWRRVHGTFLAVLELQCRFRCV